LKKKKKTKKKKNKKGRIKEKTKQNKTHTKRKTFLKKKNFLLLQELANDGRPSHCKSIIAKKRIVGVLGYYKTKMHPTLLH
jgi:hypothetical protein